MCEQLPNQSFNSPLYKAGDIKPFATGEITYLAPLPLPTMEPPYGPHVGELNDVYLAFGLGMRTAFSWQITIGGPSSIFLIMAYAFTFVIFLIVVPAGGEWGDDWRFATRFYNEIFPSAGKYGLALLAMTLFIWYRTHGKYSHVIATRFNRQRREVCFMPEGDDSPRFVPWESLSAWVVEARGATQYGVHRRCGMGIGYSYDKREVTVEFECGAVSLALAHWEALRGYMEYEIHDLKTLQADDELQGPDDPIYEGMHTFRNARARLHRRIRDKETGWVYAFFWYLFHLMTLWTLPFWLAEWENKKIHRMARAAVPEAMRQWSEPLPPEQWAKPSEQLVAMSEQVRALHKLDRTRPITEIYEETYRN